MKKYYYKVQIVSDKPTPIVKLNNYNEIIAYLKNDDIKIGIVSIRNILRNKIPLKRRYLNIVIEQYQIPTISSGTRKTEQYVKKMSFVKIKINLNEKK